MIGDSHNPDLDTSAMHYTRVRIEEDDYTRHSNFAYDEAEPNISRHEYVSATDAYVIASDAPPSFVPKYLVLSLDDDPPTSESNNNAFVQEESTIESGDIQELAEN